MNPIEQAQQQLAQAQNEAALLARAQHTQQAELRRLKENLLEAMGAPQVGTIIPIRKGEKPFEYNWLGVMVENRGPDPDHPSEWMVEGLLHQVNKAGQTYQWNNMVDRRVTLTQRQFDRLPECVRQATSASVLTDVIASRPARRSRWPF